MAIVNNPGSGGNTNFTDGSIPYASGGILVENNSKIRWDNTNSTLYVNGIPWTTSGISSLYSIFTPSGTLSGSSPTTVAAQLQKSEFFDTIAALRLWSGSITNKTTAFVRNYGLYSWDNTSTASDNGATVIVPTGQGATGRFLLQRLQAASQSFPVGAIGDSIVANGHPGFDLYNGGSAPSAAIVATAYANPLKPLTFKSFVMHAALRSARAYFPFEFAACCSGANSAQIAGTAVGWSGVSPLDVFLANPFGLPRVAVVLAGTNDDNVLTLAQTVTNLTYIYQHLIAAGVTPIAMTVPPNNTSAARALRVEKLNWAIVRLANSLQIPCADIYRALVNQSNGNFIAGTNLDVTHPNASGAAAMGYVLNQTISSWFGNGLPLATAMYHDSRADSINDYLRTQDPGFLTITGAAINTGGSRPTIFGVNSGSATLGTVFNSAGSEPGGGHTMDRAISGTVSGSTPNYLGNAYSIAGDGANLLSLGYNLTPFKLTGSDGTSSPAAGDKIALFFRIKLIPAGGSPANVLSPFVGITNGGTRLAGLVGPGYDSKNDIVQVGGETNFDAGDFYFEYTVSAAQPTLTPSIDFRNTANISNAGDSLTIANFGCVNLTQEGIL